MDIRKLIQNLRSVSHVYDWADDATADVVALHAAVAERESIIDDYALEITNLNADLGDALAELAALRAQEPVGTVFCSAGDFNFVPSAALPMDGDFALYAAPAPAAVPDGYTLVKTGTVLWLLGENGDFECPQAQYFRGNPAPYFWRRRLRADALLAAAPSATQEKK